MSTNAAQPITVAVVEDDARLRRAVAEVLDSAPDCRCVGTYPNAKTALAKLGPLKPDVILMDINLPDMTGVDCVAQLAPQLPRAQILMLTVYQDTETIFRALAAGAHGYLVKPVLPARLLEAVREVRAGGVPMSRSIARQVISFFQRPAPTMPAAGPAEETNLGPREQQVLELLVAGFSYKEIAAELDIKPSTVGTYVQRIYDKLHVRTRRQIVLYYRGSADNRPG
jgi:DNA-binding NarL/FixJ family response regulator